jgi:ParB family chromosome partitioning protein
VALQNAVASNPDVAMTLLLHKLCRASRRHGYSTSCLEATVIETRFMTHNQELKHTPAAAAMEQRRAAWNALLPEDDAALWAYLDMLDAGSRAELLAHLLSLGVTAVDERPKYDNGRTGPDMMRRRIADADRVARSVGLDMVAEAWQPTADNYLNRVTKPRILDAVREGMGEHTAQLIAHLKKGDMAREAERLLSGSGWLPELLRLVPIEQPAVPVGEKEDELPDFLDDAGVEPVEDLAEGDAEFLDAAE